jgi:hypothetical protein
MVKPEQLKFRTTFEEPNIQKPEMARLDYLKN